MSRFRLTVSCEFDTAYPITLHTDIARNIVNKLCPHDLSLAKSEKCSMNTCWNCWLYALEGGDVKGEDGEDSVHVERLD